MLILYVFTVNIYRHISVNMICMYLCMNNLNHDLFVFNPEASKMLLFLSAEEYAKEGYAIFVHLTWLLQITYSTYVVFGLLR